MKLFAKLIAMLVIVVGSRAIEPTAQAQLTFNIWRVVPKSECAGACTLPPMILCFYYAADTCLRLDSITSGANTPVIIKSTPPVVCTNCPACCETCTCPPLPVVDCGFASLTGTNTYNPVICVRLSPAEAAATAAELLNLSGFPVGAAPGFINCPATAGPCVITRTQAKLLTIQFSWIIKHTYRRSAIPTVSILCPPPPPPTPPPVTINCGFCSSGCSGVYCPIFSFSHGCISTGENCYPLCP